MLNVVIVVLCSDLVKWPKKTKKQKSIFKIPAD